ncbi:hypothetical protein HZS_4452 [Henneguya salminicola]|nr:hypothetical protein HZS_4452 [Henneguya salminicola]
MQIIGKTNELSKEDRNRSDFIQKHIRNNTETLEKMPFKVHEDLLINMRKTFSGNIYRIPQKNEVCKAFRQTLHIVEKNISQISLAPIKNLSDKNIMFRCHWKGEFDSEMYQALIWSTDESLSLLR